MAEELLRTMGGQITHRLRERILAGDYAPGCQLLQDSLAAEFGVSKIPVREALVQLQGEGLVDVFAHRGFQVRNVSLAEMKELFELRLQTEPDAVANGCRKAGEEDREIATVALRKLDDALDGHQLNISGSLNRAFHVALVVPRLQPVTADVIGRLHTLAQRYVQLHLEPKGRVKRAEREHRSLLQAWLDRKTTLVKKLTHAHIEATQDDLMRVLERKTGE